MKKLIAVILILFYTSNTFGYLILFFQLRTEIRNEMFCKIEKLGSSNCFEKIQINNADLKNNQFHRLDENEFEFRGKKYDIIKEIKDINKTIFYCINDINEEMLEKAFAVILEEDLNNNDRKSSSILHLKNKAKEDRAKNFQFKKPHLTANRIQSIFYYQFNFYSKTATPPPKIFFS